MKTRFFLTLLFISTYSICQGQLGKLPVKWGKITKEDFDKKIYTVDSGASAIILFKFGITYFLK